MDVADAFAFPPGSVVVFDRGYSRYTWHKRLSERGIFWVTRARKGMVHEVVKTLPVVENGPVLQDQIIRLTSRKALEAEMFQRKPLADLLSGRKQDPPNPQMSLRLRAA